MQRSKYVAINMYCSPGDIPGISKRRGITSKIRQNLPYKYVNTYAIVALEKDTVVNMCDIACSIWTLCVFKTLLRLMIFKVMLYEKLTRITELPAIVYSLSITIQCILMWMEATVGTITKFRR